MSSSRGGCYGSAPTVTLTFRPLALDTFDDFASMHERSECQGCFCMYWQYEGDSRAWQMRTGDENRAAKQALVAAGTTHGLLAYEDGRVIATVQFESRDSLVKLTTRMPYRGLPPDGASWAITCFRVLESHRRRGVATALLDATVEHLRDALHASAIEAFPRRADDLRDDELLAGPEEMFARAGFTVARDHMQYPVWRKSLGT